MTQSLLWLLWFILCLDKMFRVFLLNTAHLILFLFLLWLLLLLFSFIIIIIFIVSFYYYYYHYCCCYCFYYYYYYYYHYDYYYYYYFITRAIFSDNGYVFFLVCILFGCPRLCVGYNTLFWWFYVNLLWFSRMYESNDMVVFYVWQCDIYLS